MLGLSGQQFEGMGKQVQNRVQAVLCARGASGKVDDQRTAGDAADASGKRCKRCLIEAAKADLLGNPGDEAVTGIECGFRGYVSGCEACAASG
jgi:hypothetical protein